MSFAPAAQVPAHGVLAEPLTHTGEQTRSHLRTVIWAWLFGSVWMHTITGAALTQHARALGTPDWAFGFLAALPFAGALMQLPTSLLLERFGQRRWMFLASMTFSRSLWLLAAAVPWLFPGMRGLWWQIMLGLLTLSWLTAHMGAPAWMNWMADVIPRRFRGRFLANRSRLGKAVGLLVTLSIGFGLDQVERLQGSGGPGIMLTATSVIIGFAGICGIVDILLFFRVEEVPKRKRTARRLARDQQETAIARAETPSLWLRLTRPLANRSFRRYLAFNFIFTFGVAYLSQYVWLFAFDVLGWGNGWANLMIVGLPMVLMMITQGFWGRLIDRYGKRPVLLLSGLMLANGANAWLLISWGYEALGLLMLLAAVASWPGMEVANLNIIMELAGSRRGGGTSAMAVNSAMVSLAGILSGIGAGILADQIKGLELVIPVLGAVVTYHGVLLMLSSGIRLLAVFVATGIEEPGAKSLPQMLAGIGRELLSYLVPKKRPDGRV